MTDKTYNVDINGDGVSIKREVPKEVGDQIIVLMLTGTASIQSTNAPPQGTSTPPPAAQNTSVAPGAGSELSMREALDASGAKRAPDKITVIGDYVKRTDDRDFDRDDVVSMFEAAAEKVPANLSRDMKWTLKAGWIAERNGQKGKYYVTNTGTQALKAAFSPEFVKKTKGFTVGSGKKASAGSES